MMNFRKLNNIFFFLYPFIVFLLVKTGLGSVSVVFAIFGILSQLKYSDKKFFSLQIFSTVLIAVSALLLKAENLPRLYSFVVSLSFFWVFLGSLWAEETAIEKYARVFKKDISAAEKKYFKKIMPYWIFFLAVNTAILLAFVFFFPIEYWLLYAGFLFYVILITLIFLSVFVGKFTIKVF